MKNHPHLLGIFYAILSFTLWVLSDVFLKLTTESGMPIYEIVCAMGLVMMGVMFIKKRIQVSHSTSALKALWPKNMKTQAIYSFVGFLSQYLCIVALAHLPLNLFYVSVFTAPMMVALMGSFFLHERLGLLKILAIITGFLGVVLAIAPWQNSTESAGNFIGYLAAFSNAASFAACVVLSRKMTRSNDEAPESIAFYNGLQQMVLSLLMLLVLGGGVVPDLSLLVFLVMAGLTGAGGCLYHYLATTHAPAAIVGAYQYTQIISGAIIAFFVWHEMPSLHLILGVIVIVLSGLYIAFNSTKRKLPNPSLLS